MTAGGGTDQQLQAAATLMRQDAASTMERELRQKIQAHRIKRLGWSDYVFHYVMEGLGFGTSLRALGEEELTRLWEIIRSYRKHGRPAEYNYDRQGRYMHAMMKRAGWDENTLRAYMIIHYKKTHWNLLDKAERRELVELLKGLGEDSRGVEGSRGREESPLTPNPSPEPPQDFASSALGTPARGEGDLTEKAEGKKE